VKQDLDALKKSFDRGADEYDAATSDFAHFVFEFVNRKNLGRILETKRPPRLLEAGCGTGKLSAWLRSYCRELTALDVSGESLRLAAGKHKGPPIVFVEGNIEQTGFEDARFDFIAAEGGVISYTPDPVRMIGEVRRILVPGGSVWIDFYNSLGWACEHGSTDFKIETALADERLIRMPDWEYPARVFSPAYLESLLVRAGFKVEGFYANGVLLNSYRLEEKGRRDFDPARAEKIRDIELALSDRVGRWNTSLHCQFLAMKE
jgi:ubiquinone/menaquinone biosynthesis C-methylase UbiE